MHGFKSLKVTNGDECLYHNRPSQGMFQEKARIKRCCTIKALLSCKLIVGSSVAPYILKIKGHLEDLERLIRLSKN